ncbi:2-polyprenyl-6-methoxyphenol hydroxylase-like FAD-dependent oxidoreductase [Archangium gephyra]|uniref:2-polyprenyl-6-methoxyphenol hydroxylase-like FAD-dependent oxidoreductase n=1 Tax=Archangium gephyra TaxID=48 RepID=A0AAC8Q4W2_9BACT|nr:FAD-dependent oxidoreductase [Archangium gephyra]AKJ00428.1 Salicylate hydroxylase [Archangium gephyra]REG32873.1 2-polyprenyl-6-methoxyphenol hydroxylase-like FAD-dependent oxidoreductase [Archangium gephyra]
MARVSKVLIVGGGIGGLSLASGLRNRGLEVDLVEVKKEWTVYGVGIIQQFNVIRAMAQLGLVDRFLGAGFAFENVGLYSAEGSLLQLLPGVRAAGPEYPSNMGISRLTLHHVLSSAAVEKGTSIRLGLTVEHLAQDPDGVSVTFTDGSRGRYDLVVGADGLYSKVRAMVFGKELKPRFTGQGVFRHNFPRAPEIDHLASFYGRHHNAGLCPLSQDLMYLFVTSSEPGNPWMPEERLADIMRERLKEFGGLVGRLREQISDPRQVVYKPLEALFVSEPWYRGRVVLLGDAVHATTPHLGQGAGMAIEDAVVLSELLGEDAPVEALLSRYMQRRYERCRFIVESSLQIGDWEMQGASNADRTGIVRKMMDVTARPI